MAICSPRTTPLSNYPKTPCARISFRFVVRTGISLATTSTPKLASSRGSRSTRTGARSSAPASSAPVPTTRGTRSSTQKKASAPVALSEASKPKTTIRKETASRSATKRPLSPTSTLSSISDQEKEAVATRKASTKRVKLELTDPPRKPKKTAKSQQQTATESVETEQKAPSADSAVTPAKPTQMSSDGEDDDFQYDDDTGFDDDVNMGGSDTSEQGGFDDDEEAYDAFDVTAGADQPPPKKPYEITYKIRSIQDLHEEQKELIDRVAGLIDTDSSTAATLLRHFRWNSEKLTETYWEDPKKVLDDAGLEAITSPVVATRPLPSRTKSRIAAASKEPFECPVCCIEYTGSETESETLGLSCGHRFCKDCWKEYLENKIMDEAESGRIQCMESGCGRIVGEKTVEALVHDKVKTRYRELLDRTYVDDNPSLKWCPHPDCQYAVKTTQAPQRLLNQIIPIVKCAHSADHRPLTCKYVKLWEKKCADDSETSNWLMANTKECAKCNSTIEKNGGCNHMTCKKCRYEFCWVCMADWTTHGTAWYNCNRFDEKAGVSARDAQAKSRAILERYLHYFNRWANHEQSAKLDKELYMKTEKKMQEMQATSNLSWIEVQFAKRAVDVLMEARMTLKWTYAMAF
ncbi:hypothetical protein QFC22_000157 [Naganishia vaughanmartiniae]|uniref:Uncharacterized protein n=1 Tax=Naganishia vaughanmartiniae TaxID=1424756 RepID=A0ACC2XMX3_9TREE|nr:hypothetical protein QFC22_000157 [Naganishia vaughanmartiniae]